jgi:hypothetical protein
VKFDRSALGDREQNSLHGEVGAVSSLVIACVMFGCVLASTLVAMALARRLPEHHLTAESRDVVKLGLGVIATLTALVLGLLVASTKGTYDAQGNTVKELAAELALLDRILARYGPQTKEARAQLRALTRAVQNQLWPQDGAAPNELVGGESKRIGETFFDSVAALKPETDSQRMLKSRALEITVGLGHIRQRLVVDNERSIPAPLLVILGLWQAVLFAGLGLLAPRNATTFTVLIVCMLSVSVALFLVLELDRPFEGMVRISDAPLRSALSQMDAE